MPGFVLAVVLIEITPGPNMGYLALVGTRWGRRAGLTTVAGITCGLAFYLLVAAAGLGEAILRAPGLYQVLRWAGVGYLLWLAVDTWRGDRENALGHVPGPPEPGRLFTRGLVSNLLHPKAAVFYIALLPGFTNPDLGEPALQVLSLGAVHIAVSLTVHLSIVLAAGTAGRALGAWRSGPGRRWLDRGFALALGAIALWLAWETSRSA
jgi:threonine/homoserine/homoserine lactone efflux protein